MKRLIIAPHYDDEILGCGGIISKYQIDDFFVYHATFTDANRYKEWNAVRDKALNIVDEVCGQFHDSGSLSQEGTMQSIGLAATASSVSEYVNKIKPNVIYIPYKSLHQDHVFLRKASLIALRNFCGDIYEYEYTDQFSQYNMAIVDTFEKLEYQNILEKVHLMSLFESQINKTRDSEAIKALARIRGYSAGCKYAEGFNLVRSIK